MTDLCRGLIVSNFAFIVIPQCNGLPSGERGRGGLREGSGKEDGNAGNLQARIQSGFELAKGGNGSANGRRTSAEIRPAPRAGRSGLFTTDICREIQTPAAKISAAGVSCLKAVFEGSHHGVRVIRRLVYSKEQETGRGGIANDEAGIKRTGCSGLGVRSVR